MANEAVCIELPTRFCRKTVADGTAVVIGTLMKLTDPNTAIASSGNDAFAGIAWETKTVSDGITELTLALDGVWDIKDYGLGFNVGAIVCLSGTNLIRVAAAGDLLTGTVVGKAEETASAAEVVRVRVGAAA